MNKYNQLCVWQATLVGKKKIKEFEQFMKDTFGVRAKYKCEVKTLPDVKNGRAVAKTGGRNDLFFYIHDQDVNKFAVQRLAYGIRWYEDVINNGGSNLYTEEFVDELRNSITQ